MRRMTPEQISQALADHVNEEKYGADGGMTKCNLFVRDVAESLLQQFRPELHGMANEQFDHLNSSSDWLSQSVAPDITAALKNAHDDANSGQLVIIVYKNPDSNWRGHIAIITPSPAMEPSIDWEMPVPFVGQAGPKNPRSVQGEEDVSVFASLKLSYGFGADTASNMAIFVWTGS